MLVSDDHHRDPAKRSGHRDDGHEEEILQADSDNKKKVTNSDEASLGDSDPKEQVIMNTDERKRCGDHTS